MYLVNRAGKKAGIIYSRNYYRLCLFFVLKKELKIMKRTIIYFFTGLLLASCNVDKAAEKDTSLVLSDSAFQNQNATAPEVLGNQNTDPGMTPVSINNQTIPTDASTTTLNPANATSTTVGKGMNPPHGQPNHRCDIPVGAPLSSPPANPVATQPVANTTASTAKTAPGMNPPHGEPGHRCDISVGAPLSSAPATPAANITPAAPKDIKTTQTVVVPNAESAVQSVITPEVKEELKNEAAVDNKP